MTYEHYDHLGELISHVSCSGEHIGELLHNHQELIDKIESRLRHVQKSQTLDVKNVFDLCEDIINLIDRNNFDKAYEHCKESINYCSESEMYIKALNDFSEYIKFMEKVRFAIDNENHDDYRKEIENMYRYGECSNPELIEQLKNHFDEEIINKAFKDLQDMKTLEKL